MTDHLPNRHNHRLKPYDYGQYGYYFVTLCTKNRANLLSNILSTPVGSDAIPATMCNEISNIPVGSDALVAPHPKVALTPLGEKVLESWHKIESLNENVALGDFVFMPNHIHGIVIIRNTELVDFATKTYDFEIAERRGRRSLQGLIKDFKSVTTRTYQKMYGVSDSLWQTSFYEQIIRSQEQYYQTRKYIAQNPLKWTLDKYFKA